MEGQFGVVRFYNPVYSRDDYRNCTGEVELPDLNEVARCQWLVMGSVENTTRILELRLAGMMNEIDIQSLVVGGYQLARWWRKHQDFPVHNGQCYNYAQRWMNVVWKLAHEWYENRMQQISQEVWDILVAWFLRVREVNDREISGERGPN